MGVKLSVLQRVTALSPGASVTMVSPAGEKAAKPTEARGGASTPTTVLDARSTTRATPSMATRAARVPSLLTASAVTCGSAKLAQRAKAPATSPAGRGKNNAFGNGSHGNGTGVGGLQPPVAICKPASGAFRAGQKGSPASAAPIPPSPAGPGPPSAVATSPPASRTTAGGAASF